ncbi:MAG TPA: phospho-N-acetylmuramoyl-pentapeptide-transferase [Phycisphaerae bacterium]|nr:phospho-N-acetylmuramoyl-pentapeptide-transferase [Phycisphaerae bacterium]HOB75420.1 phospho-N-acetylmuramoyl-pentapeptide-transferase [Phycisphaerae bacterium]HOJ55647.1 phospho-N-acetylmuramoyl-pentapeptide-transferase [Phycisphaerae bacterium]HOL27658.1 phospho-N-acetylmuramoyl-pentapeptide-transferase [Phycisphaerae bacterium]HPP21960.1 phospho-N-acetylmuramoyl-pentapeptide-transferase [Phycisphaerae bacterium]
MLYHLIDYLFNRPETEQWAYRDALVRGTCAIFLSFLFVWLLGPRVIRWLMRRKIGDIAEFDHKALNELTKDKKNTPTMGGVLIIAAVLFSILMLADLGNYYITMALVCTVWLTVVGGIDDWLKLTAKSRSGSRDGLKSYEKLLFQIGLGVLLGIFVYRYGEQNAASYARYLGAEIQTFKILTVPFYKPGIVLSLPLFWIMTVLVTTGTSNAVNLTDGMDGLASGCMVLCSFAFMILSFMVGNAEWAARLLLPHIPDTAELAVVCGAVMGACLGFLWYNCYPAQVFMGDTGSLPLGGLIGYVAIVTRQELMLFIVGGVFVIEAVSVMLQVGYFKLSGGKRIFRIAPIHHHFHLGGWTETQTVTRFWLMAVIFAGIALVTVRLR